MMAIGRRGFIGGMIAAVAGGEAVIKLASPAEASLLKPGHAAGLLPGQSLDGMEGRLYLAVIGPDGQRYEALGWARNWSIHAEVDTLCSTSLDMDVQHYRVGTMHRTASLDILPDSMPEMDKVAMASLHLMQPKKGHR